MSASRPRLVRSVRLPAAVEDRIREEFTAPPPPHTPLDTQALFQLAEETKAQVMLVTHHAAINAAAAARIPASVQLIATVSVGLDHLDVKAIRARGIAISNTPDVLTDCNADMAMLLLLTAARRAAEYTALVRKGWGRDLAMDEMLGMRVTGKTLGIIGMGRIGQAVARRARGFGMTVLYNNRRRLSSENEEGATWVEKLDDMLPRCQIVSLHLPGSDETDGIVDAAFLSRLPKGAIFVNAARGRLVNEDALIDALRSGQLAGAGLDVCRNEPHPDPRLLALPNLFMTPHVGSATVETRTEMGMLALDNATAQASGKPLLTPVEG
ncbi:2-hydroxyacid dehydrogenase [Acetobacter conturbans]|uniref:D-glycerate dehydrogenase n=1 Tax=Acetobacter conturbans TaxID=1737472 RepID=A0ABX0JZC3_9PROT|nr:D-glycerate dehydrogenase [Acetobacter conturbans]NHN87808.1 D-glycerate dehydrogenase [Acetobacter conturbans]